MILPTRYERSPLDTQRSLKPWRWSFINLREPVGTQTSPALPVSPPHILISPPSPVGTPRAGLGQRVWRRDSRSRVRGNQHHLRGNRLRSPGQQGNSRIPRRPPRVLAILCVRHVRLHVGGCGAGSSDSRRPGMRGAVAVAATTLATITAAAACVLEALCDPLVQTNGDDDDNDYPRTAIFFVGRALRSW